MFDSSYNLVFIQSRKEPDNTCHLRTYIYKFYSPFTKLKYIVLAEYYTEDVFAKKFYPSSLKHSNYKYNILTHKKDVPRILKTVAMTVVILLKDFPKASFAFYGSPIFYKKSCLIESGALNKRCKIYFEFVKRVFGTKTFAHLMYKSLNAYLLVNKENSVISRKERLIAQMFVETYQELPEDLNQIPEL